MRQIEIDMRSPQPPQLQQPAFDAEQYFAKGGPVIPSSDPMGSFTGMEGIDQDGRDSGLYERLADRLAGAGVAVGEPARQAIQGVGAVPSTIGTYLAETAQKPDPSQRVAEDIRKFGSAFAEQATSSPTEFAKTVGGFLPGIGEGISAYDAAQIYEELKQAESVGDTSKADTLRQLYGLAAAGAVPGVGMAARVAGRAKRGAMAAGDVAESAAIRGVSDDLAKLKAAEPEIAAEHPGMIDTRYPTGKARIAETEGQRKIADFDALRATPEAYEKNVSLLRDYVNMPEHLVEAGTDDVAEHFINHVKDNLVWLHDQVPAETRARSQLWYDGARNITDDWSKKYDVPDTAVAGALAALSPQKDWYQNVSLANRVIDALKGGGDNFYQGFAFSPEMQQTYESIGSLNKEAYVPLFDQIKGKSLGDINKLGIPDDEKAILKAMWVRLYDEAHNSKSYKIVTPEGGFSDVAKTGKGADAKVAWGSMNEIGKAIQAIESNGDPALLNEIMGSKHKVRNFYNNILAPNSPRGDVTIDTHAVAAGLLRPLSQKSVEVAHNFKTSTPGGLPGSAGSAASGIQGTYPLYAEAYRRAAAERDILPRQMQSITWEAARGLFPDTFKSANNMAKVDDLWRKYRTGEATIDETRQAVSDLAGGIEPPTWHGRPVAPDEAVQRAPDPSGVSGSLVSGQAPEGTVRRREGGPAFGSSVGYASGGSVSGHAPTEKMKVDAYVGPHQDSTRIFIINQKHPHTNRPGEHKVMLGYKDRAHAVRDYTHSFSDGMGHKRVHSIVEMDSRQLRDWLKKPRKAPVRKAAGGAVNDLQSSIQRLKQHV